MAFYIRDYSSDEKFDISKFLNFQNDVYDTVGSPFLALLPQLPTVKFYHVNEGFKDVDLISSEEYGTPFLAYIIQFYNNDFREVFPEGTVLKLFSLEDLNEIYYNLSSRSKAEVIKEE